VLSTRWPQRLVVDRDAGFIDQDLEPVVRFDDLLNRPAQFWAAPTLP
jgi:hypothetical protein